MDYDTEDYLFAVVIVIILLALLWSVFGPG